LAAASEIANNPDAQPRAQKLCELCEVLAAWPNLSPELRTAVLVVTRAAFFAHAAQCTVRPELPHRLPAAILGTPAAAGSAEQRIRRHASRLDDKSGHQFLYSRNPPVHHIAHAGHAAAGNMVDPRRSVAQKP
jgi:hypothetical protein